MSNVCEICGNKYKNLSSLKRHLRVNHDKVSEFRCCGRHFRDQTALKNHLCCHHKAERLHSCDVCKKSFATVCNLKKHHNQVHGEKTQMCKCGKSFTRKADLLSHQGTHSVGNKYICNCGKSFKHRSNLGRHKKRCAE